MRSFITNYPQITANYIGVSIKQVNTTLVVMSLQFELIEHMQS